MSDVELTAVRPAHRFDEAALDRYLAAHVPGYRGPLTVRQFEGGQSNPTFLLEASSGQYVMRKQPPGDLLPSAHAVDREFRVMDALGATDVPVPQMHSLCIDTDVLGTKFYVMEYVEGRVYIVANVLLPGFDPADRRAVFLDMARTLARLHTVDPVSVGLGDFGRPGNYFARQINRWSRQYVASETETIPEMNQLIEWLPDNIPEGDASVIVHGDYRLGNLVLHPTQPRVVAILDWELSTRGDGLADLSYWCQDYYGDPEETETIAGADLEALGIPTEDEIVQAYCEAAGRDRIDHWLFYIAYNMFRTAAINQGVYKRGLDGNASSETALEYGLVPRKKAVLGWGLVEQMGRA